MSEEQLAALLAKIRNDAGLQEKLKGAADLDAVLAIAKDAGFEISKADWLKFQAQQTIELSDEKLENVAGGFTGETRPPNETAQGWRRYSLRNPRDCDDIMRLVRPV
jgi:predicted ribosomally synthesized peptide with nif11-like leader